MSRAEHNADSPQGHVHEAKQTLARILKDRTTKQAALSSHTLADRVDLKPTTVRDCIKDLRREYDLPVVSCSRGYYVLSDTDGLERELARISEEIATREETRRELTAAFNARYGSDS